jgi:hypothetical protein
LGFDASRIGQIVASWTMNISLARPLSNCQPGDEQVRKRRATVEFDRLHPNISNPCRDDERGLTLPEFRRKLAAWQRIVSIAGI